MIVSTFKTEQGHSEGNDSGMHGRYDVGAPFIELLLGYSVGFHFNKV